MEHEKNRYEGNQPYSDPRKWVRLSAEDLESQYINASVIWKALFQTVIATQAPLKSTETDFWKMVWEKGSSLIINLCSSKDIELKKCTTYWPLPNQPRTVKLGPKTSITISLKKQVEETQHLFRWTFKLKQTDYDNLHTVKMIHFTGWPDHSVPSEASFFDFYEVVKELGKHYLSKSQKPVIIHCSAGLGRTGTLILSSL